MNLLKSAKYDSAYILASQLFRSPAEREPIARTELVRFALLAGRFELLMQDSLELLQLQFSDVSHTYCNFSPQYHDSLFFLLQRSMQAEGDRVRARILGADLADEWKDLLLLVNMTLLNVACRDSLPLSDSVKLLAAEFVKLYPKSRYSKHMKNRILGTGPLAYAYGFDGGIGYMDVAGGLGEYLDGGLSGRVSLAGSYRRIHFLFQAQFSSSFKVTRTPPSVLSWLQGERVGTKTIQLGVGYHVYDGRNMIIVPYLAGGICHFWLRSRPDDDLNLRLCPLIGTDVLIRLTGEPYFVTGPGIHSYPFVLRAGLSYCAPSFQSGYSGLSGGVYQVSLTVGYFIRDQERAPDYPKW